MVCTFFGHRTIPVSVKPYLHEVIVELIENRNIDVFYVGNQGAFDSMVRKELQLLSETYKHISCETVLAYLPEKKIADVDICDEHTFYPEGLETIPRRFAVDKRNRMMTEWADYVVCYVCTPTGGAHKFYSLAEKKGKNVINLYDLMRKDKKL